MVKSCSATYVILGHSETRDSEGVTSEMVKAKVSKAHEAGLIAIVCVGELLEDREDKNIDHLNLVWEMLCESMPDTVTAENTVIAYEPVWAIGTGLTASPKQAQEMHQFLRDGLEEIGLLDFRIIYGGSVKPDNAAVLFDQPDINGFLVGGASLNGAAFSQIINHVFLRRQ